MYTHYLYDAGGNRVKKYTRTAGGNWETITYIDGLIEYREDQDGKIQSINHVMDDTKRIATIREGNDFGDTTPAIKYNLDDHLGSSNVLVDENGTLVNQEEYYPFGETSFGSYTKKRYRFCGKEKDEESGMYYYGARYYSPWLCRFISVDPLAGKYVFQTPYAYADNNPINKMDYNGEGTGEGGGEASVSENNIKGGTPTPENKSNDTPGFFTNLWRVFTNQTHLSRAEKYSSVISKCASKVHVVNIDENTAVVVARFDYAEVKNDKGEVVEKAHSEYRYSVFRESKPGAKFTSFTDYISGKSNDDVNLSPAEFDKKFSVSSPILSMDLPTSSVTKGGVAIAGGVSKLFVISQTAKALTNWRKLITFGK